MYLQTFKLLKKFIQTHPLHTLGNLDKLAQPQDLCFSDSLFINDYADKHRFPLTPMRSFSGRLKSTKPAAKPGRGLRGNRNCLKMDSEPLTASADIPLSQKTDLETGVLEASI